VTASRGIRATRSDKGAVRITHRDLAVLEFIADQYAVPMELFRELLGRHGQRPVGARVTARTASRLETAGLLRRHRLLGETWLAATPLGLKYAGREYDRGWQPAPIMLNHMRAVSRLRLWLTDHYPGSSWESERSIRHHWSGTGARVRFSDGGLYLPDGLVAGVELELTLKHRPRYGAIVADQDPRWQRMWWFTRLAHVVSLRRSLEEAGAGPEHEVFALTGELAGVLG
jgi:hypothetical protein